MIEAGAPGTVSTATLLAISLASFVAGCVCRKWPDKVQELAEMLDGSLLLLSPRAHRALIRSLGVALTFLSACTLLAATFLV